MKKLFLIIIISLVFTNSGLAETIDGNNWNNMDLIKKAYYIRGLADGNFIALARGLSLFREGVQEHGKDLIIEEHDVHIGAPAFEPVDSPVCELEYLVESAKKLWRYNLTELALSQLTDGLDELYKDFKNRQIAVYDAVYVVRNQIQGASKEDIERILLYLRGGQKDFDLLRVKDEKGDIIRIIKFP